MCMRGKADGNRDACMCMSGKADVPGGKRIIIDSYSSI